MDVKNEREETFLVVLEVQNKLTEIWPVLVWFLGHIFIDNKLKILENVI